MVTVFSGADIAPDHKMAFLEAFILLTTASRLPAICI